MGVLKFVLYTLAVIAFIYNSAHGYAGSEKFPGEPCPSCVASACTEGTSAIYFPGDCTKFCDCHPVNIIEVDCPDGLHFNSIFQVCDWPIDANCEEENTYIGTCTPP